MAELEMPSRRGFLSRLGALFAAPAIVRVEALMPVKVWEPRLLAAEAAPLGMLDIGWITREYSRLVYNGLVVGGMKIQPQVRELATGARLGDGIKHQRHVDFMHKRQDRLLPGKDFSERILKPAADVMVRKIRADSPEVFKGARLAEPTYLLEHASGMVGGIAVRGLTDYSLAYDALLTRLDIAYG